MVEKKIDQAVEQIKEKIIKAGLIASVKGSKLAETIHELSDEDLEKLREVVMEEFHERKLQIRSFTQRPYEPPRRP
jgi:hypothetical protein